MMSNPNKTRVITPYGIFPSKKEAARQTGIAIELVSYRCKVGEKQRREGVGTDKRQGDYRGWIAEQKEPWRRRVKTPLGEFDTVKEAADAHKMTSAAIVHKIKSNRPGFEYLN